MYFPPPLVSGGSRKPQQRQRGMWSGEEASVGPLVEVGNCVRLIDNDDKPRPDTSGHRREVFDATPPKLARRKSGEGTGVRTASPCRATIREYPSSTELANRESVKEALKSLLFSHRASNKGVKHGVAAVLATHFPTVGGGAVRGVVEP